MRTGISTVAIVMALLFWMPVSSEGATAWSQLPSANPFDGYSYSSETGVKTASLVADNFTLENDLPIAGVTWWGSYWDVTNHNEDLDPYPNSDNFGDPKGSIDTIEKFTISFHEAGIGGPPWGHPSPPKEVLTFDFDDVNERFAHEIVRGSKSQTVYQYYVDLDAPYGKLVVGTTYWLSIQADNEGAEPVQWGWQRAISENYPNAVQDFPDVDKPYSWDLLDGTDMAFELEAVPIPSTLLLLGGGLVGLAGVRKKLKSRG